MSKSKFKAGQLVIRTQGDVGGCVVDGMYVVSEAGNYSLKLVGHTNFAYDIKNFELAETLTNCRGFIMSKSKFEVGQQVIRTQDDFGECVVGEMYVVSETGSTFLKLVGHTDYVYSIANFKLVETLILEQGEFYEFSNKPDFNCRTAVAKFIVDLSDHCEDDEVGHYPLMAWSQGMGLANYAYARKLKRVPCKVLGCNLMVEPADALGLSQAKEIQKSRYTASEAASKDLNRIRKDMLAKYVYGA